MRSAVGVAAGGDGGLLGCVARAGPAPCGRAFPAGFLVGLPAAAALGLKSALAQ